MTYADVTARPSGTTVRVEAPDAAEVRFDGMTVPSPAALLHLRAASSDLRSAAVGTKANPTTNPDSACVVNDLGVASIHLPCFGNQACAIEWDGATFLVCVVDTKHSWRTYLMHPDSLTIIASSGPLTFPPEAGLPDGTSQGFRDLLRGVPSFYDDQVSPLVIDGVSFWRYLTRGNWTVGLLHDNRVALWDALTATRYVSTDTSPVQARLALQPDGTPLVAVSTDTGSRFLTLANFTLDVPIPPDPPDPEPPDPEPPDPEPPDPIPEPEPEPEEPMTIYFREKHQSTDAPNVDRLTVWGEKNMLPDGRFWVRLPSGEASTLTPKGKWETRPAPPGYQPGDWEIFGAAKPAGTIAQRVDSGTAKAYYLETYEG